MQAACEDRNFGSIVAGFARRREATHLADFQICATRNSCAFGLGARMLRMEGLLPAGKKKVRWTFLGK